MATRTGGSRHAPPDAAPIPSFKSVYPKALEPSDQEIEVNARSRSAKLRVGERLDAVPTALDDEALGLPRRIEIKNHKEGRA
ncbi:MAG: hypothetical protein DHS20C05_20180 [Hyphococcus sp.]|nr:MAG: hypothetical protein DHS20C05_20180 [Marinicaulis sp.]